MTYPDWPSPCRPTWTCSNSTRLPAKPRGSTSAKPCGLAATRLLDMGPDDLQLLIVQKPDDNARPADLRPDAGRFRAPGSDARPLAGTHRHGEEAAGRVSPSVRNGLLRLPEDVPQPVPPRPAEPAHGPGTDRGAEPRAARLSGHRAVFEEERPEDGTPSNTPEARLLRLLHDHHFPAGECRKRITTSLGIATEPDWLHEPTKVAVYLDGMSRGLHGDPNVARKDQIIRQAVELDGYTVIVVQTRDLDDPQAVRQHLRNIAQAMGRADLDRLR